MYIHQNKLEIEKLTSSHIRKKGTNNSNCRIMEIKFLGHLTRYNTLIVKGNDYRRREEADKKVDHLGDVMTVIGAEKYEELKEMKRGQE